MVEYIDREAAIAIIEDKQRELCPAGRFGRSMVYGRDRDTFDTYQEDIDALENIPAADVQLVVRGHWVYKKKLRGGFNRATGIDDDGNEITITIDNRREIDEPYCSECGKWNDGSNMNFCGVCGANMT